MSHIPPLHSFSLYPFPSRAALAPAMEHSLRDGDLGVLCYIFVRVWVTSVFGREGRRAGEFVKRKMWTGGREHGRENRRGAKSRSGKDGKIDMVDKIICIIENELIQRILEFFRHAQVIHDKKRSPRQKSFTSSHDLSRLFHDPPSASNTSFNNISMIQSPQN